MSKNTRPKIGDQNAETGELIYREMDDIEFAQYQKDKASAQKQNAEDEAKATAKAEILDRLGLTADELKTILG
jgi:hypothetical protein